MADRRGLGMLGYIFGGITAFVMVTAFAVVVGSAGRLAADPAPTATISLQR